MSDIEQTVRLTFQSHSFCGSEPKKIHSINVNDHEESTEVRRTPFKPEPYKPETYIPRAAVFVSRTYKFQH
jgi:hypothetical protein